MIQHKRSSNIQYSTARMMTLQTMPLKASCAIMLVWIDPLSIVQGDVAMNQLYGGVEAGGTKFVCALGSGPDDLHAESRFPTTTPDETIGRVVGFFREHASAGQLAAVGIASFGPVGVDRAAPRFGHVFDTTKPSWSDVDFLGRVQQALGVPVSIDTDVNGAALGEQRWGAAQGLHTFVYLTVGTGIGGGGMVGGQLIHGLLHPEIGHMRVPHDRSSDPYAGWCSFHGDCWEGLACGPAIAARWGQPAHALPLDHPAWELEAHYLALGLHNLICTISPQRIVLGGGVIEQRQLLPMVRQKVQALLNGYLQVPAILSDIDHYIVPPALGNRAGVLGAIALAQTIRS